MGLRARGLARQVVDDALPLSHFAPLRRTELISLQSEAKAFVRGDNKDGRSGESSKSSGKRGGANGFKADARKSKGPGQQDAKGLSNAGVPSSIKKQQSAERSERSERVRPRA